MSSVYIHQMLIIRYYYKEKMYLFYDQGGYYGY